MRGAVAVRAILVAGIACWLAGCGGGGGSNFFASSSGSSLAITTTSLPGTLQGHAYSAILSATGGQGALHWSIFPISPTTLFVNGLSVDANTGVISGIANFSATAGFTAQVSDSASPPHTATKNFTITAGTALIAGANQQQGLLEYQNAIFLPIPATQGGVSPLAYSVTAGALPPGVWMSSIGRFSGNPYASGTFQCTVTVQDSLSPPEVVSEQLTIVVNPPALAIANALPSQALSHMLLNRPFSGRVVAIGGVPPYHFLLLSGALPPGTFGSIDPNTGQFGGTPSTAGTFNFTVIVSDSASPANQASGSFSVTVAPPLGRNDTPATATSLPGNGSFSASISPYIDPPNGTPVPGDNDYYKLVSLGGSTVHVETQAKRLNPNNPLDTVLEIVDGNGQPLTTCRQPGDTSSNFNSACINDDISASPRVQDSALDFQVPGASNVSDTFYAHVLDWRGDARPDMTYTLQISGIIPPLAVATSSLAPGSNGVAYSRQLASVDGTGTITWSVLGGALPPGLTMSASGGISGTPTTDGTYTFTVQATDSANPPQTATAPESIQIVGPLQILSSVFPNACVNQPYSYPLQTSGGAPPLQWGFYSPNWVAINLDPSTGVFSGTTNVAGTFTGTLMATDATGRTVSQSVSLTVTQCP